MPAYHLPVLIAMRDKLNRPIVAVIAVGLIAGTLRFMHLGFPERRIFDEYYYSKSACIFLGYSNDTCDINSSDERYWRSYRDDTGAWVHPPLGKWMIALGELADGANSYGWRIAPAITGTLSVVALAIIVQLLFNSPLWTFAGGLLLATESLNFVQSRVAMLDIFVTFWIVLGFLFMLLDRRWIERRTPEHTHEDLAFVESPPEFPEPLWRPWRFAAGAAFGAAIASKWSGLTGLAGAIALTFIWEIVRRKHFETEHPIWRTVQIESFGVVLAFLFLPAAVYVASYTGWFIHFGFHFGDWLKLQHAIESYHAHLSAIDPATHKPIHPYLSVAWKWILLWRPVSYYADYTVSGVRKVIYSNGNPAIFWGALLAIPWTAYAWWSRRDWRAGFIVVAILFLYAPWFLVSRPQFLFYATPITPFFVLACLYFVRDLSEMHVAGSRSRPYLPIAVAFVVVSVALFVFFWPVLTGGALTDAAYKARNWFPTWT